VADLGDRLRARGARVWHQYDGVIDVVAAADPLSTMGQDDAEIPRPVAIESDGTEQYRTMSVRERSRLRPQLLERLGWRYMPLWTIEVFTDPSACADRIAGYLGLEKVVLPGRAAASAGFFEDDVDSLTLGSDDGGDQTPGPGYGPANGPAGQNSNEDQAGSLDSEEEAALTPGNTNKGPARSEESGAAPDSVAAGAAGILPNKASEDDPRRWGDGPDNDHDAWLKEQKPPHWG
jgi:hypothetical protein